MIGIPTPLQCSNLSTNTYKIVQQSYVHLKNSYKIVYQALFIYLYNMYINMSTIYLSWHETKGRILEALEKSVFPR